MLSPIKTTLAKKLEDKGYRTKFFRGRTQDAIAYWLREARKKRKLTQPELEKLSGMKQSAISRIEQASYCKWNFKSLLTLADALDLRVRVEFDYAEDVIKEYERIERMEFQTGSASAVNCNPHLIAADTQDDIPIFDEFNTSVRYRMRPTTNQQTQILALQ